MRGFHLNTWQWIAIVLSALWVIAVPLGLVVGLNVQVNNEFEACLARPYSSFADCQEARRTHQVTWKKGDVVELLEKGLGCTIA